MRLTDPNCHSEGGKRPKNLLFTSFRVLVQGDKTNSLACIVLDKKVMEKMATSYSRESMISIPQGTLIDIETTDPDSNHDEMVVFGYVERNYLRIICRTSEDEKPFIVQLANLVPELPRLFYAYNLSFEKEFLKARGMNIEGIDLFQPWREKAEELYLKWPKLDELFSHAEHYFNEPVISGKDVPLLWERFLRTGNKDYLQQIIRHNESDLLRELYLLVYYRDSYRL